MKSYRLPCFVCPVPDKWGVAFVLIPFSSFSCQKEKNIPWGVTGSFAVQVKREERKCRKQGLFSSESRLLMSESRCLGREVPVFSEKEVSISPERSKRFRKTPPSFCRKQGAPTRKARLSDPKRALIESKKSASGLFGFLSAP